MNKVYKDLKDKLLKLNKNPVNNDINKPKLKLIKLKSQEDLDK